MSFIAGSDPLPTQYSLSLPVDEITDLHIFHSLEYSAIALNAKTLKSRNSAMQRDQQKVTRFSFPFSVENCDSLSQPQHRDVDLFI